MWYGATFLEKTIFRECYVVDRNIDLAGLDWIGELNLTQFLDENDACQTPSLKPTNKENLMRRATSVYMLPKSLPSRGNHILTGLSSNLPLRSHYRCDQHYGDKFTLKRVRCYFIRPYNKQISHLYPQ
ncbi:unnamed protein product [Hymenolepis diminuta]|uniref:Uncharacterized protein n=1 Tax=Hymenolepis diminuta TaxID=6216 RepID=A0A564YXS4_HYMDI|nr:unnamed protein product [Hymenolepis diminuta]